MRRCVVVVVVVVGGGLYKFWEMMKYRKAGLSIRLMSLRIYQTTLNKLNSKLMVKVHYQVDGKDGKTEFLPSLKYSECKQLDCVWLSNVHCLFYHSIWFSHSKSHNAHNATVAIQSGRYYTVYIYMIIKKSKSFRIKLRNKLGCHLIVRGFKGFSYDLGTCDISNCIHYWSFKTVSH